MKPIQTIMRHRFGATVRRYAVVLLSAIGTLSSVFANLEQDTDKIEDLYGNIVERRLRDDGTVSVLYHKDRYLYLVVFANNRSTSETYLHVKGTDLSEKEDHEISEGKCRRRKMGSGRGGKGPSIQAQRW